MLTCRFFGLASMADTAAFIFNRRNLEISFYDESEFNQKIDSCFGTSLLNTKPKVPSFDFLKRTVTKIEANDYQRM